MMRRFAAALILIGLASSGFAQDEEEKKVITLPYDGPDFFCHILFAKGLAPVATFDEALNEPSNTLIVVWGDWRSQPVTKFFRDRQETFRKKGGSLCVATDYRLELPDLGVTAFGNPVFAPEDQCFGGHMQCPWLSYTDPGADDGNSAQEHPLFHLLQNRIATNRPTYLTVHQSELKPMLPMPRKKSGGPGFGFGGPGFGLSRYYLAVSPKDTPPHGRTLIMAGHGMFTNGMMLQPETDNFAFAINAVEWLREAPNRAKRTRALFVVDGEIITNFDRNLSPPLPPIPMPTVEMVNRLLRGLEDEGFFHWALQQAMGDSYRNAVPFIFGLGTCVVLLYGAKKFLDARVARETGVPRMVGAPTGKPAEARVGQRQKALYRMDDASEEARMLARHWLASEFGLTAEQLAASAISIQVAGFFLTRGTLQRQVDYVIQLASASQPAKVSRSQFTAAVRALPRLGKAHRAGRLTLLLNRKEVT